jgi:hypothetical protein
MTRALEDVLQDWSDALRLTNALYSLYKQQRARTDAYESQLMEIIEPSKLTAKDWDSLKKKLLNPPKQELE